MTKHVTVEVTAAPGALTMAARKLRAEAKEIRRAVLTEPNNSLSKDQWRENAKALDVIAEQLEMRGRRKGLG